MLEAGAYNWSSRPTDVPMPLLERQRVIGEQAMISRVLLRKGCDVPAHAHANEQFCVMLSGHLRFELGAEGSRRTVDARAGDVVFLPSNLPHSAYAVEESLVLDVFSPPSATTGIDVDAKERRAH